MLKPCQDSYSIQFNDLQAMMLHHTEKRRASLWERATIHDLHVEPLDKSSPLCGDAASFDPTVSEDAIMDTAENLGLAIKAADFSLCGIPPTKACWAGPESAETPCPS